MTGCHHKKGLCVPSLHLGDCNDFSFTNQSHQKRNVCIVFILFNDMQEELFADRIICELEQQENQSVGD